MNPRTLVLQATVIALLPSLPAAQGTPSALIGGAFNAAAGPMIQRQVWCTPGVPLCLPVLGPPVMPFAGGTAYDPGTQTIWNSDGLLLTGLSALSVPPCAPVCPPVPCPGLPAGAFVCGLAFAEDTRSLWVIDSTPALMELTFVGGPCPVPLRRCGLAGVIPPTHTPGGLAYSEKLRMVLYSVSMWGVVPPNNLVFIAPSNAPCAPVCMVPWNACGAVAALGAITGLAYDDCTDTMYATDGALLANGVLRFVPPNCQLLRQQCCNLPVIAAYYGLCIEPSHPVARGMSCTAAPCPNCPALAMSTTSDPTLGNARFALQVSNAPAGSVLICMLGPGPCTPGIPVLCGLYYPILPPAPVMFGIVGLGGPAPCGGSGAAALPVPMDVSLCGSTVCVQGLVLCLAAPGPGVGLTNALDLTITDT